eukprot:587311-Pyramimonas_sp.AAC.2
MVNSGKMTRPQFVAATSSVAAQVFNIFPRKGLLAAGSDADVIVLDPNEVHTITAAAHHSAMDTNIYEGVRVEGKVVVTVSQVRHPSAVQSARCATCQQPEARHASCTVSQVRAARQQPGARQTEAK